LRDNAGSTGHLERQVVTLEKADQEFRIPAESKPNAVLIDPDHDLLRELRDVNWTDDQIPTILRWSPNSADRRYALDRIKAGPGLTEDQLTQLYADALRDEYNDTNASQLMNRLGSANKESLRPLFREQLKSKMQDRRPAALDALGKLPATPEDTATIHAIGMSDTEPYNLVDSALTALAHWSVDANLDVFKHQIAAHSLRDRLAIRSINLLSAAKTESSASVLISATAPTYPRRVRTEAISGLEDGPANSAPIHEVLVKIAQSDATPAVQVAAIRVLRNRKDKSAEDMLKGLITGAKDDTVKSAAKDAVEAMDAK
jgi:aminopeptidase N